MASSSKNRSFAKTLRGLGELTAMMGSGLVAEPVAGWGGILATTTPGADSSRVVEGLRRKLTYEPGEAGREVAGDIGGMVPDWIKQAGSDMAADYNEVGEAAGALHPALGAAVDTIPTAIGTLFPYAQRAKRLGAMVPEGKLNKQAGILRGLRDEEVSTHPGVAALQEGGDINDVWRQHGVGEFPGLPGKYFDEIDDSGAAMTGNLVDIDRLTNVLSHQEMYRSTPPMKFATAEPTQKYEGFWNPKMLAMGLNPNRSPESVLGTAIHEGQHGVAGLTGLPQGTSPGPLYEAATEAIDKIRGQRAEFFKRTGMDESIANEVYADPKSPFREAIDTSSPEWKELEKLNEGLGGLYEITNSEFKRYNDNMGEAIARMAEARRTMNKAQRSESYPFSEENFKKFTKSDLADALRSLQQ